MGNKRGEFTMRDCDYIPECTFYHDKLDNMPPIAEFMKMEYCHKHSHLCARKIYYVAKSIGTAPVDLMPNETDKVKFIM